MQITLTEQGGHLHHEGDVVRSKFAGLSYPVRWGSKCEIAKARNRYQLAQALRELGERKGIALSEAILPDCSRFVVEHELKAGEAELKSEIAASFAAPAMEW